MGSALSKWDVKESLGAGFVLMEKFFGFVLYFKIMALMEEHCTVERCQS